MKIEVMLYRVYCKNNDTKETVAICKDKRVAEEYVKYREKEIARLQKEYYSLRGALLFYEVDEILEDDDIKQLLNKN